MNPALLSALNLPQSDIAKALLDAGADANAVSNIGSTMLFAAAGRMPVESLQLLLARGADVNATWQGTPLSVWFALDRRWDLLAVLVERGVDMNRPYSNEDARTATSFLTRAMENSKSEAGGADDSLRRVYALIKR